MQPLGLALGVLIAMMSGFALILLVSTAVRDRGLHVRTTLALTGELLAIPTFWFGGPWVTTVLLTTVDLAQILPSYMISLSVTFTIIAFFPLLWLILSLGRQIAKVQG